MTTPPELPPQPPSAPMNEFPFRTDLLLESLPDGFQVFDREWRYVYLNRRAEQMLGRSREELLGKVCWAEYPEAVGTPFYQKYQEAMESGQVVVFEDFCPHENIWVEFSLHPYPGGLGAFARDITARKRADEALRQSEIHYRALFNQVLDVVLVADDSGRFVDANPAACQILGIPRDQILGKSLLDFTPLGTATHAEDAWHRFLQQGEQAGEFVMQRPDGTLRILDYRARANVLPGLHLSVLRDVTERKAAAERSAHLWDALNEERETLDKINEIGRLLSAELNLDRLVQAATDAATELTGAQFGAFFYNVHNEQGESYLLYTISGVPREAFSRFPMPRATHLFGPTFRGEGTIRIGDVKSDPRYGKMAPYHGMPPGHLPVRSYLAVPVVSRSGEVLGGLFFGHAEPNVFSEKAERNVEALVAQLAVAMDNARLFGEAQRANEEARLATERRAFAEALRQSEERFRLLIEQVQDYAIFMLDPQGNVATWNEGAERVNGYTADEIIGQHFSRFYTESDIAARHPWGELEIASRVGRYEEEGWRVRKDGTRFWSNVVITALRDETGELRGFGKVTRDITERRAREQEQAAAQIMEQQRRLLKDVLSSVTDGRLILCDDRNDLPEPLPPLGGVDELPIRLEKQTLRRVRQRTKEAARIAGFDDERESDLLTAVSEAAMNAIVHAGGGIASVGVDPQAGVVQVRVEDEGPGIDMSRLPRAALDRRYTTAGSLGHGFKMVLATADRVWLLTGPTGTTVVLEQGRDVPKPGWLAKR